MIDSQHEVLLYYKVGAGKSPSKLKGLICSASQFIAKVDEVYRIVLYELTVVASLLCLLITDRVLTMPAWYLGIVEALRASVVGGIGGCLYCLRGVYLNKCVLKKWDTDWHVWYYLRPIASTISGFASYLFLKAGLLMLDAEVVDNSSVYGYLAVAFVSGYNVDNFLRKLEAVAQSVWGVSKSKASDVQRREGSRTPNE